MTFNARHNKTDVKCETIAMLPKFCYPVTFDIFFDFNNQGQMLEAVAHFSYKIAYHAIPIPTKITIKTPPMFWIEIPSLWSSGFSHVFWNSSFFHQSSFNFSSWRLFSSIRILVFSIRIKNVQPLYKIEYIRSVRVVTVYKIFPWLYYFKTNGDSG